VLRVFDVEVGKKDHLQEVGDGLIGTTPNRDVIAAFEGNGGSKPKLGQLTVCWAPDERTAIDTAMTWWPIAAVKGELMQELPLPRHFEQATEMVTEDQLKEVVVCGPDVSRYLDAIGTYDFAGYDHVFIHQVGPEQEKGLRFLAEEVLPELRQRGGGARKAGRHEPTSRAASRSKVCGRGDSSSGGIDPCADRSNGASARAW